METNDFYQACETCNNTCEKCFYTEACKIYNETGITVPLVCNGFVIGEE